MLCKRTHNLTAEAISETFCKSAKPYEPVAQFSSLGTPYHVAHINSWLQTGVQYSGRSTPSGEHIQYFSSRGLQAFLDEVCAKQLCWQSTTHAREAGQ